jgi:hypothetical protein
MSSSLNNLLSQAYGFIEADQLDDAVALLKPILADNPNNPDAWWLYAHAVENVDDARAALQTVLALDPNYPEAQRLLELLDEATKGVGSGNPLNDVSLQPIRAISDEEAGIAPSDAVDARQRRPGFDERVSAVQGRQSDGFPWRNIALLAALFVCALIAAALLGSGVLNSGLSQQADQTATAAIIAASTLIVEVSTIGTPEPAALTATAIIAEGAGGGEAQQSVASPTPELLGIVPTPVLPPTDAEVSIDLSPLTAALMTMGDGTRVGLEATSRGETVVATLCSEEPNVSLRDTLRRAVGLLAGQAVVTEPQVEGVAFRLVDCTGDGRVLRFLTAAASDVVEYAGGVIDAAVFEARLATE